MKIMYVGPSDSYELGAEDFKKGGVEDARKTRFPANEPVEVSDEVASLLLEDGDDPSGAFEGFKAVFKAVEDESSSDGPLRGAALEQALDDAGLSKSGTVAEKQARLAEHQGDPDLT